MPKWDQDSFNRFITDNEVYGFFEQAITLKSGRKSHFYANWRNVVEDAWSTERLSEYVVSFVTELGMGVDTFYGVPEGATKLGILTQYHWARHQSNFGRGSHVLAMGRAKPKEHGAPKDRYFVGQPRGRVIMLEDVTTTGGSSLKVLDQLLEADITVTALISLTNRMEKRDDGRSVREAVEEKGVPFYSMSSSLEILPVIYRQLMPGREIGLAIEEEFELYGINPLKLSQ